MVRPQRRSLRVLSTTWACEDVLLFTLVDPLGGELPTWEPGAHLEMEFGDTWIRQYSLCGDRSDTKTYTVAVRRDEASRGASAYLHATQLVGRTIETRGPRNNFDLLPSDDYLFFAGGIGITPILPMIEEAEGSGANWRLHYGGRSRETMPFLPELGSYGEHVEIRTEDRGFIDFDAALASAGPDTLVYACGPSPMLAALRDACDRAGLADRLKIELFSAAREGKPTVLDTDLSFEVRLARTGATVTVPPERTILEVVREIVPSVPSSCEGGICGTCETAVLSGTPDHRDSILSEQERAESETMMICVSRCVSGTLELDL